MEIWAEVRRRVLAGELSKREACREYRLHWDTLTKILTHEEPPGTGNPEVRQPSDAFATGESLYALCLAGNGDEKVNAAIARGCKFLVTLHVVQHDAIVESRLPKLRELLGRLPSGSGQSH